MAKVQFKRIENNSGINNIPIVDGQLIYTKEGKQYMDYNTERVDVSGAVEAKGTILWTNNNPNIRFAYQTISLNTEGYDLLEIYSYSSTSVSEWVCTKVKLPLNLSVKGVIKDIALTNDGVRFTQRRIYNAQGGWTFENCTIRTVSATEGTVNNNYLIPVYIIGYKLNS